MKFGENAFLMGRQIGKTESCNAMIQNLMRGEEMKLADFTKDELKAEIRRRNDLSADGRSVAAKKVFLNTKLYEVECSTFVMVAAENEEEAKKIALARKDYVLDIADDQGFEIKTPIESKSGWGEVLLKGDLYCDLQEIDCPFTVECYKEARVKFAEELGIKK